MDIEDALRVVGFATAVWILWFVLYFLKAAGRKGLKVAETSLDKAKKIAKEVQDKSKSEKQKIIEIDEDNFLVAQKEIDDGNQIESLWIKAKVLAEGNKDMIDIEYIKLRVSQLDDIKN
ncbi:hypothetical protein OA067_04245 [Gammaproteobacteria bacterium]|nr:hypothetical protein [Gammaproteobacteria bacterium]